MSGDGAPPPARGLKMAQDATAAFAVQIMAYVVGLLASVLIARALGPAQRGIYAVAISAAAIAVIVFHAGAELAASYFFAERGTPLSALTRNAVLGVALLSPLAVGAMLALYAVARGPVLHGIPLWMYLCVAATLPFQLHQLWMANLLALAGRLRAFQRVSAIVALAQVIAVVAVDAAGALDLGAALSIYLGSMLVSWALCVRALRSVGPIGPPYDIPLFRATLGYGLRLHGGYIAWHVLLRLDLFLVAWWLTARDAGIYAVAVVLGELAWQLTMPLGLAAIRPQMASTSEDAGQVSFQVARVCLLIAGALAVVFAATLWIAVPVLYGHAFAGAYPATVVLLPGVVAMAAFRPLYNMLVRLAPPFGLSAMCAAAAAVDVAINAVLLKPVGIVAASLSSTIAYSLLTLATARWASARTGIPLRELVPGRRDVETLARNMRLVVDGLRAR